jgi:hypothetical protein
MHVRSKLLGLGIVIAALLTAPSPGAECFILTAKFVMQEKAIELVFSGTVVNVTRTVDLGYRATFEVDRVWKGSVPRRFDIYVWEGDSEIPRFEINQHPVVLAHRLTEFRAKQHLGAWTGDVLFGPVGCSIALDEHFVRDLGPWEAPK